MYSTSKLSSPGVLWWLNHCWLFWKQRTHIYIPVSPSHYHPCDTGSNISKMKHPTGFPTSAPRTFSVDVNLMTYLFILIILYYYNWLYFLYIFCSWTRSTCFQQFMFLHNYFAKTGFSPFSLYSFQSQVLYVSLSSQSCIIKVNVCVQMGTMVKMKNPSFHTTKTLTF